MFWHARSTQTLSLTFFSLPLSLKISLSHVSPPLLSSDTRTAIYPWSFSLSLLDFSSFKLRSFQVYFVSLTFIFLLHSSSTLGSALFSYQLPPMTCFSSRSLVVSGFLSLFTFSTSDKTFQFLHFWKTIFLGIAFPFVRRQWGLFEAISKTQIVFRCCTKCRKRCHARKTLTSHVLEMTKLISIAKWFWT